MFTCVKCKTKYNGTAPLENGVGSFCVDCFEAMQAKAAITMAAKKAVSGNACIWCRATLTTLNRQNGITKGDCRVCRDCATHVDWMLAAARRSDRLFRYVMRTEERERPLREARAEEEAKAAAERASASNGGYLAAKIREIEQTLAKLKEQL